MTAKTERSKPSSTSGRGNNWILQCRSALFVRSADQRREFV